MSDDSGTGLVSAVLNVKKTVNAGGTVIRVVKPLNPLNWGRLARAVGGSVVVSISLVGQRLVNNVGSAVVGLFDGATDFLVGRNWPNGTLERAGDGVAFPTTPTDGLIGQTLGKLARAVPDIWPTVDEWGVAAYPAALVLSLLVVYVVSVGGREALSRAWGG